MKTHVFRVEIEKDKDGRWAGTCPALPGCATWGYTRAEALRNIQEAVEAFVVDLLVTGDPIPAPQETVHGPVVSVVIPGG